MQEANPKSWDRVGFGSVGEGDDRLIVDVERGSFEDASAPVIARAFESVSTVSDSGAQRNISQELTSASGYSDEEAIGVHPLTPRDTSVGVSLADSDSAKSAAIETHVLTSESWIEALGSR